jgi:uncharacterized protein
MPDLLASVNSLHVYPVKSCAGLDLPQVQATPTGFEMDRTWMVIDDSREMVSQRDFARLCLVAPQPVAGGMLLSAPGMPDLLLDASRFEHPLRVHVWGDVVKACDMGALAADWITDYLHAGDPHARGKYRIVRFDSDQERLADMKWTLGDRAMSQFSDGFPILVASRASLDELNRRLNAQGHSSVSMERFRPNLVLDGIEAHDEDRIDTLTIETAQGPVLLRLCKPCPRCPMPNINPSTAKSSPEVGDTLQTYRSDARVKGAITFGMNAYVVDDTGAGFAHTLRVGDACWADFGF